MQIERIPQAAIQPLTRERVLVQVVGCAGLHQRDCNLLVRINIHSEGGEMVIFSIDKRIGVGALEEGVPALGDAAGEGDRFGAAAPRPLRLSVTQAPAPGRLVISTRPPIRASRAT